MPIRLNLLAEAQALEDLRRRDPVKRAIWGGALLVLGILVWSSSLKLEAVLGKGDLNRMDAQLASHTNAYRLVLENQKKLADANRKLTCLRQLSTNRFLLGSVLNALQQAAVDDVQLTRLRSEQTYLLVEETKPTTEAGRTIPGKPGTATEKIAIFLDAKDTGPTGDQVNQFKKVLADGSFFQNMLGKSNEFRLVSLSPPRNGNDGKSFVSFTLECRFPDRTR